MPRFVFLTGVLNIFLGLSLQSSWFYVQLLPEEPDGALIHAFGWAVLYLGILLILCSRDLAHRGSLVAWEGMLRIAIALTVFGYSVNGSIGTLGLLVGALDGAIGLVYLAGMPRHTGLSLGQLLRDRPSFSPGR